jgi:hypothetical protein
MKHTHIWLSTSPNKLRVRHTEEHNTTQDQRHQADLLLPNDYDAGLQDDTGRTSNQGTEATPSSRGGTPPQLHPAGRLSHHALRRFFPTEASNHVISSFAVEA